MLTVIVWPVSSSSTSAWQMYFMLDTYMHCVPPASHPQSLFDLWIATRQRLTEIRNKRVITPPRQSPAEKSGESQQAAVEEDEGEEEHVRCALIDCAKSVLCTGTTARAARAVHTPHITLLNHPLLSLFPLQARRVRRAQGAAHRCVR